MYSVMPSHFHGVIQLLNVGATRRVAPTILERQSGPGRDSIGAIIGQFKSVTTKRSKNLGYPFSSIWQRNYYEHVIRNEEELEKIREYIAYNPLKWATDRDNPEITISDNRDEIEIILGT